MLRIIPQTFTAFFTVSAVFLPFSVYASDAPHATEDWDRRAAFARPGEAGENITDSWDGGHWKAEGLYGSYRFIIAEHKEGIDKLYLQWVTSAGEAAYSLSVKELNAVPEYDIDLPVCLDGDACNLVKVVARHHYEGTQREFTIDLEALGKYNLKM